MASNHLFDGLLGGRESGNRCLLDVPGERTWSYAELVELSGRFANLLQASGLAPGERIAVQVDKSAAAIALYLATVRAGGVFLPLNTAYTAGELDYFVADAQPTVCVCRYEDESAFAARLGSVPVLSLSADHQGSLMQAANAAQPTTAVAALEPGSVAAILYTSGTTWNFSPSDRAFLTRFVI